MSWAKLKDSAWLHLASPTVKISEDINNAGNNPPPKAEEQRPISPPRPHEILCKTPIPDLLLRKDPLLKSHVKLGVNIFLLKLRFCRHKVCWQLTITPLGSHFFYFVTAWRALSKFTHFHSHSFIAGALARQIWDRVSEIRHTNVESLYSWIMRLLCVCNLCLRLHFLLGLQNLP